MLHFKILVLLPILLVLISKWTTSAPAQEKEGNLDLGMLDAERSERALDLRLTINIGPKCCNDDSQVQEKDKDDDEIGQKVSIVCTNGCSKPCKCGSDINISPTTTMPPTTTTMQPSTTTMQPSTTTMQPTTTTTPTTTTKYNPCKADFILIGSNCYHFNIAKQSWGDALITCTKLGAAMAHPMTAEEDTLLINYIRTNYPTPEPTPEWWLGATDVDKEGHWVWAHSKTAMSYSNWGSNQPRNYLNSEHCLSYFLYTETKWNDLPCQDKHGVICEQ